MISNAEQQVIDLLELKYNIKTFEYIPSKEETSKKVKVRNLILDTSLKVEEKMVNIKTPQICFKELNPTFIASIDKIELDVEKFEYLTKLRGKPNIDYLSFLKDQKNVNLCDLAMDFTIFQKKGISLSIEDDGHYHFQDMFQDPSIFAKQIAHDVAKDTLMNTPFAKNHKLIRIDNRNIKNHNEILAKVLREYIVI